MTGTDFVARVDLYAGPTGQRYISAGETCERLIVSAGKTLDEVLVLNVAAGFIVPVGAAPVSEAAAATSVPAESEI